ncbi:MAG: DUF2087 domain-containing protein [Micrococcus sp.]|nr:DUF2087 domain-containing protein [Micrococcus sp.]
MSSHVRPARSFLALLRNPKLRRSLGAVLAGTAIANDADTLRPATALGAVTLTADGTPHLDETFLRDTIAGLDAALSPLAVLDGERIDVVELAEADVDEAVARVARRVVGSEERVSEENLNGRLALFVEDVAFFRRHAVDLGVLDRELDGSAYWRR